MEPPRSKKILRPIKDIIIAKSFMATSIVVMSIFATSCTSDEYEEDVVYTKNVHTMIKEITPNRFQISEEQIMEGDKSRAYITFLDGTMEEISLDSIQHRLQHEQKPYHYNGNGDLGEVLVASAFGSMLSPHCQYQIYPHAAEYGKKEVYVSNRMAKYFVNKSAMEASNHISNTVVGSRIRSMSGSVRGFFSSFHSSGRG
jgi:hypothetical protein